MPLHKGVPKDNLSGSCTPGTAGRRLPPNNLDTFQGYFDDAVWTVLAELSYFIDNYVLKKSR
jgi:hypothetical protein